LDSNGSVGKLRANLGASNSFSRMKAANMIDIALADENALNQERGVAAPPAAHTVSPPATSLPSAPLNGSASAPIGSRSTLAQLAIPLFAVLVAFAFIALATLRWDAWVGHATIQTTNDAYSRLSSRVAGEVLTVAAKDFQRVKAGDLLVQIDPPSTRRRSRRPHSTI
jgi:hypothetical protein